MIARPRATLSRIIEDLDPTLLEVVCGQPASEEDVRGIAIYDPLDSSALPEQSIVLGIGLQDPDDIARVLTSLAERPVAALVVRAPVDLTPIVTTAAEVARVTVLALAKGATWNHLALVLQSRTHDDAWRGSGEHEALFGDPAEDLFALANAIGELLDAAIAIEDSHMTVLAFSGNQDKADSSRIETILGRQVPERYMRKLAEQGLFDVLHRSDDVLYVNTLVNFEGEPLMPRAVVAVRAGGENLGTIWAAVRQPLTEEQCQALRDAAKVVAFHILRLRAGADARRRLLADLLARVLEGGSEAREALVGLGLDGQPLQIMGIAIREPGPGSMANTIDVAAERQRLSVTFSMHLSALHPRAVSAAIGGMVYAIVPVDKGPGEREEGAVRVANEFLARVGDHIEPVIGISEIARDPRELAQARINVNRIIRVLLGGSAKRRVAQLSEVHIEILMQELGDVAERHNDKMDGPVSRLLLYDRTSNSNYIDTLQAWFDSFGDIGAASDALFVHPNTLRYRLKRISEIGALDLDDPAARFAAMVHLRLIQQGTPLPE